MLLGPLLVVSIDLKDFFISKWSEPLHPDVFGLALPVLICTSLKYRYHLAHKVDGLQNQSRAHQLNYDVVGVTHPGAVQNWESQAGAAENVQYYNKN